jgi:hypothetical protein
MEYHLEEKLMGQRVRKEWRQAEVRRLAREARKAEPSRMAAVREGFARQFSGLLASLVKRPLDAGLS